MPNNQFRLSTGTSQGKIGTPQQIIAQGGVKIQSIIVLFIGLVLLLLAIAGIVVMFTNPAGAKDMWGIIAPIIMAIITGAFGFLAGKHQGP
jgi:hypothetical protein